jgi:tape measure domain-containing protein
MTGATIDKRVVEMEFLNGKFERGVSDTLRSIDNLKKGLNFTGAAKGFSDISEASGKVNLGSIIDSVDQIKNRFSLMGIVGMTVIQNLTNSAIDLAKKLFNVVLGVDNIRSGFGAYETKVNAIRTVMAGTGETIDEVTKSIADLNAYSDRTIYSFEDMTANISKFTNAGLSSREAATAIQGISNVAAMAGADTNEASRAMYNFGQAMQQGSVRLMDWKSIENANMATIGFKTQLLEKAAAFGILRKEMDGTFTLLKDGSNISATKGFNESLQEQWLTTEVLTGTLSDYASQETAIGKEANAAATQIKTWTQLMATMADSMKTGWTKSFEFLIGDLNEATALFTYFGDIISKTMGAAAQSRNELLKGWKELGGRNLLIDALTSGFEQLGRAITPIMNAFRDIFPPMTAERLFAMTKTFTDFVKQFKVGEETADKIKRIFKGLFSVFDVGRMIVSALAKQIGIFFGSFSGSMPGILEFFAQFGDKLSRFRDSAKSLDVFNTVFENIFKVIGPAIKGILGFFGALISGLAALKKPDASHATSFLEALAEKSKEFGKLGIIISKVLGIIKTLGEKIAPIAKKIGSLIGNAFNGLLDLATTAINNFDVNKVLDFLNKGLFAGILLSLKGFIDTGKEVIGGGLFAGILLSIKTFIDNGGSIAANAAGILDKVKDSLAAYQKSLQANTLMTIAKAIGLLVLSILVLTFINPDKLISATTALGVLLGGLLASMTVMDKVSMNKTKILAITIALGALATAMLVFTGVVLILGNMKQEKLIQGVAGIVALLTALTLFTRFADTSKGFIGLSIGLSAFAISMLLLSVAIKSLGNMDTDQLVRGLLAMGGSLAIFALTVSALPPNMALQALGIAVMAGALLLLSKALKDMGGMSWEEIGKGLTTLGISLGILAIALIAMNGSIAGSAAVLVASAAIGILAISLVAMSKIPIEGLGIALLGIAGVLTILGIAGAVLTPVVPTLLLLGTAMLLLGIGALGVGVGLLAFSAGLAALAVSGSAGALALGGIITIIVSLIPMIAKKLLSAILDVITLVVDSAPRIVEGVVVLFTILLDAITEVAPKLIDAGLTLLDNFLSSLDEKLPSIVEHGYGILLAFLSGFKDNIGPITLTTIDIIRNFIDSLATGLPLLAQSGWDFIISWINSVADAAEKNIPALMEAVRNLGSSVIDGIITGWTESSGNLITGISTLVKKIVDSFKEKLGINSPSTVFVELATQVIDGFILGINESIKNAVAAIREFGDKVVGGLKEKYNNMVDAGRDLVTGFADGISGQIKMAVDKAGELARSVLSTIKNVLDMNSPSRVLTAMGNMAGGSFAGGISDSINSVVKSTDDLSNKVVSSFGYIASKVSDALNTNLDFTPSIRPVVDLTDIEESGSRIQGLLGQANLSVGLATDAARTIAINNGNSTNPVQQGENSGTQVIFNQNNYSPKELSRMDIYRQTRNQLRQLNNVGGI